MTSVLAGIDGSDGSLVALRWAADLADAVGVPLRPVWAWQYPADTVMSLGAIELPRPSRMDELAESQMRDVLDDVLGPDADHVDGTVRRGSAVAALMDEAGSEPLTIVVGSRGLGGFKGLLLGSVGRQLCEHATCPVTIVPRVTRTSPTAPRRLVVGTDGSSGAGDALRHAARVAAAVDAELVVAHASESGRAGDSRATLRTDLDLPRERVERWCAPLRDAGVAYDIATIDGDPRTALLDVVRQGDADLLIVGSRGRGPVARLLLGSVAASLAQHTHVPITIVPSAG